MTDAVAVGPEAAAERRLRVFLVDDHAMFRAGVRAELGAHVDVVGEASTVPEAVTRIAGTEPDVVLLDVHMPDGGGRAVLENDAADASAGEVPGAVGVRRGRGRDRADPGRRPRLRHQDHLAGRVGRRDPPGGRGRRGVQPAAGRVRARRVRGPPGRAARRPRAGPADQPGARGAAAAGARVRVQGDRQGAVHLDQDGRDARVERAAQAPDVQPVRALPLGGGPAPGVAATGGRDRRAG